MTRAIVVRWFGLATGLVGGALLARPAAVAGLVAGPGAPAPGPRIVGLLGLRGVAQGTLLCARPGRTTLRLGAATDAVHAVSMVVLALVDVRHRRSALASGLLAATSATIGSIMASRMAGGVAASRMAG